MPPNIVLIGFMGCGKSTVGRILAQKLEWRLADTDSVIERIAGCDIPSLFATEGEAAFRIREATAVLGVSAGVRQVISTGGGAILRDDNIAALRAAGLVIWLTARPEVILERTARRQATRPMLMGDEEPLARILRLLGERGPRYQRAAHRIVDTSDRTPQAIAGELLRIAERWEES